MVMVMGRKVSRLEVRSSGDQEWRLSALVLLSSEPRLVSEPMSLARLRSCSKLLMLDFRSEIMIKSSIKCRVIANCLKKLLKNCDLFLSASFFTEDIPPLNVSLLFYSSTTKPGILHFVGVRLLKRTC